MFSRATNQRSASLEPEAGSAATEMQTTARKSGNRYILNGTKHWITGGGVSKLHLVFARVLDERGVDQGIGGFILFADPVAGEMPKGFEVVEREYTLGLCGMPEAVLRFTDVEIDEEWLVQPPSGLKRGFADLMNAYNSQRVGAGDDCDGCRRWGAGSCQALPAGTRTVRASFGGVSGAAMDDRGYGHAGPRSAVDAARGCGLSWALVVSTPI